MFNAKNTKNNKNIALYCNVRFFSHSTFLVWRCVFAGRGEVCDELKLENQSVGRGTGRHGSWPALRCLRAAAACS